MHLSFQVKCLLSLALASHTVGWQRRAHDMDGYFLEGWLHVLHANMQFSLTIWRELVITITINGSLGGGFEFTGLYNWLNGLEFARLYRGLYGHRCISKTVCSGCLLFNQIMKFKRIGK
ncbi:hypothetical protein O6H91_15G020800 [Diphasiastrum complanatum]|uniref:Uncharacterized protein n=1 Tax=Diphasiastrum complanatum TaxID=34168 RepID=A0ACC2BGI3_DIPCM|nr:hypothetical protein O6H91_Y275200 [Diphasiastrum complanatum]KAJ7528800.1 hypothetical protein O6H91_15G020800 [Diphasiastrum complanatum]